MKRKLLSVLLAGTMVLSLAACGNSGSSDDASSEGGGSEGGRSACEQISANRGVHSGLGAYERAGELSAHHRLPAEFAPALLGQ